MLMISIYSPHRPVIPTMTTKEAREADVLWGMLLNVQLTRGFLRIFGKFRVPCGPTLSFLLSIALTATTTRRGRRISTYVCLITSGRCDLSESLRQLLQFGRSDLLPEGWFPQKFSSLSRLVARIYAGNQNGQRSKIVSLSHISSIRWK